MQEKWNELLQKLGIAKTFSDAARNHKEYVVNDEALLKMVNYLGFSLKDINDSDKLLQKIENRRWQYVLESIYVVRKNSKSFSAVVKAEEVEEITLEICKQNGEELEVEYQQKIAGTNHIGKTEYAMLELTILSDLEPDYYTINLYAEKQKHSSILAVAPDRCYVPQEIETQRLWGFAIQLYALESGRNWGVGDFTDLQNFIRVCQKNGADVIGVNPLNVLFHDFPENASPYSSISRLFLNPIYIDVEKVYGYQEDMVDKAEIEHLRNSENIDYIGVYNLKIKALHKTFEKMKQNQKSSEYKNFIQFCDLQGEDLDNLATYQSIYSEYCHTLIGGWRGWPKELQNPNSSAVREFKNSHQNGIMFFKYLQYVAEQQFDEVFALVKKCGLKVGLYRDLPVGVSKDSAELWGGNDLFIKDCGAGAPPDIFFPSGQKWCLGAFNPFSLKAQGYKPFIKVLRAAMHGAGALRIDHVMSLMRLYIIPDSGEEGTYVYFNFDDMLGIVALESYLNRCMVVGESIGNVPDGFIEKIHEYGIYSLSVLWAERWNGAGDFKMPKDFSETAFCSVGTHDMAPLKMRWFGGDIETMYQLKMLSDNERIEQYKGREDERIRLLAALDFNQMWPQDKPRQGDCIYGEGYPNGIMEAVEKYAASGKSQVYLAQLEDIFGVNVLQNLPGTDRDKHPNWRRKLPVKIEDYEHNSDFNRAVEIIREARK